MATKKSQRAKATPKKEKPAQPVVQPEPTVVEPAAVVTPPEPVAPVEPVIPQVAVATLSPGQMFEAEGNLYRVRRIKAEGVDAAYLEWTARGDARIERWSRTFPVDAMVEVK